VICIRHGCGQKIVKVEHEFLIGDREGATPMRAHEPTGRVFYTCGGGHRLEHVMSEGETDDMDDITEDLPGTDHLAANRPVPQGDTKYGRIYTAEDIDALVTWLLPGGTESDTAEILATAEAEGVQFRFPADEPLMLLRGQDRYALEAIDHYAGVCADAGVEDSHLQQIGHATMAFRNFANTKPERVKQPDS
jgi:hypothetical protein